MKGERMSELTFGDLRKMICDDSDLQNRFDDMSGLLEQCGYVKVNFCKDCRWYDKRGGEPTFDLNWCIYHDVPTLDSGYCSFAKQR